MIKANVSYLVENVGMDGYLHLVYVELGNANLGIANCPGDGGYYVVHEGRYDELKKAVKMGGGRLKKLMEGKLLLFF